MNRFAKIALIALFVLGAFALFSSDADAGCYYKARWHAPVYQVHTTYYAPTIIAPVYRPPCSFGNCGRYYNGGFYTGPLSTTTPYGQLGW